ncbi:MAG: helix-turn-helix domain-containing protein [Steroidobacteraceae bacterium]
MPRNSDPLPPLDQQQRYSIPEAVQYLRLSRGAVYKLISAGELRILKQGKRTFVPGSEIARLSTLDAA